MTAKITDLPQSPTEWEPTPHLRWVSKSNATVICLPELQQKWVEMSVYRETAFPQGATIRRPTGKEEWRTVPTEEP